MAGTDLRPVRVFWDIESMPLPPCVGKACCCTNHCLEINKAAYKCVFSSAFRHAASHASTYYFTRLPYVLIFPSEMSLRYGQVEAILAFSGRLTDQVKDCLTRAGIQVTHALKDKEAADKVCMLCGCERFHAVCGGGLFSSLSTLTHSTLCCRPS